LVDIRSKPIEKITPTGLRTADADYALDAIVFATGFDAMTGAMKEIDIHTDAGMSVREKWEGGPRTYLGIMIAGFPNLFMITGPQSPGIKSQMILACEQHVDWIADCVQYLRDHRFSCIEAEEDAEDAWVQHNNEVADRTLYPLANSWYVGANIPGKPLCSCRMSAALRHTRRDATRSRPGATKAFVWVLALKSSGLQQIDVAMTFCS
jgi:cyclohexanone monooxygenase